jgi:hypothetical protein
VASFKKAQNILFAPSQKCSSDTYPTQIASELAYNFENHHKNILEITYCAQRLRLLNKDF